jgi:hypothetical protein
LVEAPLIAVVGPAMGRRCRQRSIVTRLYEEASGPLAIGPTYLGRNIAGATAKDHSFSLAQ